MPLYPVQLWTKFLHSWTSVGRCQVSLNYSSTHSSLITANHRCGEGTAVWVCSCS